MSRQNKFRAWDIYKKVFIPTDVWAIEPEPVGRAIGVMTKSWEEYSEGEHFYPEHQHVMQFTGLLDKNGKEIYEGDIVKYTFLQTVPQNGSTNVSVSFYEGGFIVATVNGEPLTLREAIKASNKADGLEIIGNIYENPDLLSLTHKE